MSLFPLRSLVRIAHFEAQLNGVRRDSRQQEITPGKAPTSACACHASCFAVRAPQRQLSSLRLNASSYYAALVLRAAWPPWLHSESPSCAGFANLHSWSALRLAPFAVETPSSLARLLAGLPPQATCRPYAISPSGAPAGSAVADRSSITTTPQAPLVILAVRLLWPLYRPRWI